MNYRDPNIIERTIDNTPVIKHDDGTVAHINLPVGWMFTTPSKKTYSVPTSYTIDRWKTNNNYDRICKNCDNWCGNETDFEAPCSSREIIDEDLEDSYLEGTRADDTCDQFILRRLEDDSI